MKIEYRNAQTIVSRGLISLTLCLGALLVTGCSTTAPHYLATNDNVRMLQNTPGGKVSVGQFTAKSDDLNHISIRAGSYTSPYNDSYAEYLKAALQAELEGSAKFDAKAQINVTGELLTNTLDAAIGTGSAHISARIAVKRNTETLFDKVIRGDNEWESSFIGAVAIPLARQQYGETVKKLLANLFADRDFQKAINSGANSNIVTTEASMPVRQAGGKTN